MHYRRAKDGGESLTRKGDKKQHEGGSVTSVVVGTQPVGSTPEALTAYMKEESAKYAKLIKQIGLKGE
jgi:hypothetical protein